MTRKAAARPLLQPLVPLYRLGLALREAGLRMGLEPTRRLKWPVVSVGNLSTGGSGKTPLVIALAKALKARGECVDVLSRGYGRGGRAPARVYPNGSAREFGDEPIEIARAAEVPVFVSDERYEAGLLAEAHGEESHPSDKNKDVARVGHPAGERVCVHLLDDGFQHRQLHRDVDILLMNRRDLEDHLLPAGNLREGLHAAARSKVIAIPAEEPDMESAVRARGWGAAIWRLRRRMDVPKIDAPAVAFCGIARPEQFFAGIEAAGVRLVARFAFHDHHVYTQADLNRIASQARSAGAAALLTTEKDRARLGMLEEELPASLPLQTVTLRIEFEDESAAIDWLISRIRAAG
jgi:tetraacyldisaccharide 4'-kinase